MKVRWKTSKPKKSNSCQVNSKRLIQMKTDLKSTAHNALTSPQENKMAMTTKKRKSAAAELWPENVPVVQEPLSAQQNNAHNNRTRCARGEDMTYLNSSSVCTVFCRTLHLTVCVSDVLYRKRRTVFNAAATQEPRYLSESIKINDRFLLLKGKYTFPGQQMKQTLNICFILQACGVFSSS